MKDIYFFKHLVNPQVFYCSKYTYALVNIKPLVPGHVLIVPFRKEAIRLADLTAEESIDYMTTLQLIHKVIISAYKADSLNIAIQDGPESGQSVPHLHTHIIPRYHHDGYGDTIHKKIEDLDLEQEYSDFFNRKKAFSNENNILAIADEKRVARTAEVMEKEALWLKQQVEKYRLHS